MTAPIFCVPDELFAAGSNITRALTVFQTAVTSAAAEISQCAGMAGCDPAGKEFGTSYDTIAGDALTAAVDTANAGTRIGAAISTGAANHSTADSASCTLSNPAPLTAPSEPASISVPAPPTSVGSMGSFPGVGILEALTGLICPNGDPGTLRDIAGAWRTLANAASDASMAVADTESVVTAQSVPEQSSMEQGVTDLCNAADSLATNASSVAAILDAFATEVSNAQTAAVALASRITTKSGIAETITGFLTDPDAELDEIKQEFNDIVSNFARQVAAIGGELAPIALQVLDIAQLIGDYAVMTLQTVDNLLYNSLASAANATASLGSAVLDEPMAAGAVVGGAALMTAGAFGEGIGFALDATGIGALVGVPANVVSAAAITTGAATATAGGVEIANAAARNQVVVMEARSTTPHPDYPDRYTDGRFRQGNSGVGKDKEAEGVREYKNQFQDFWVTTEQRVAHVDGVDHGRRYDALARKYDGTYEGIEVKSGSARLTPNQREFDGLVSRENPAHVTITNEAGEIETIEVTSTRRVNVK